MEEGDWSREPSLPKKYTSLLDLQARWMKKQQEEKERLEKERGQQQQKENLKQLQPEQQNQQPFHSQSNKEEERECNEEEGRRTQNKRRNEVNFRPRAYNNCSNWNAWRRSRLPVIGGQYRSHVGDRRPRQVVLAHGKVAGDERKSDESEAMNKEEEDYETDEVSRRDGGEGEVKEPEDAGRESLLVSVSSMAMTDSAMKSRVEAEEAGVARNPWAKNKGTVRGRREKSVGEVPVPVAENKDVMEEEVVVVKNPRNKRKGKSKARGGERVGEMHVPVEKKDAVEEVERKEGCVIRNTGNKKKGMVKPRGEVSIREMHLSTEEDAGKDDKLQKGKKKEGEMNTLVEMKEKEVGPVVSNSRIERNAVKRHSQVKRTEVIVESKMMEVEIGSWKEKGCKIRAESENVKDEVGVREKKVSNLSMQYSNDQTGSNGTKYKLKDNDSKIRTESESLKDEDGVIEESMRNGVKIDRGKENESKIRAESEVWKNGVMEVKMRNGMKIEQRKGNENKIWADMEVLKDEVEVVEEKLSNLTMMNGNGSGGSNGMKTKPQKESESLNTEVGVVGEKLGGFTLKLNDRRGRNGMKRYGNRVHQDSRNRGFLDSKRREKKSSGGEMVWVKKVENGDGKIGGTRTSNFD